MTVFWHTTLPWIGGGAALVFLATWALLYLRAGRDRSPRARDVVAAWGSLIGEPRREPLSRTIIVTTNDPSALPRETARDRARRRWGWAE